MLKTQLEIQGTKTDFEDLKDFLTACLEDVDHTEEEGNMVQAIVTALDSAIKG